MIRVSLLLPLLLLGCSAFQETVDGGPIDQARADGGDGGSSTTDGPPPETAAADHGTPGDAPPATPCLALPLPCLDPAPASVIEVPTEASIADAFASAKANDTIQIRGAALGAGWKIPAYVTLRGCLGARIAGGISFAGSGGTVEGFTVEGSGTIVANQSGAYVIRHNRFGAATSAHGVSARSVDALVFASVTAVVEGNWFEQRTHGVDGATKYDTGTHEVDLTLRNNVFHGVDYPIQVSEGGLVGKITAVIEHNTLYDFVTGMQLTGLDQVTKTRGNLLVQGNRAVSASAPFEVSHSATWQVAEPGDPPFAGAFASADPALVDPTGGDLRPGSGSAVVDVIPANAPMPAEDYLGCPRPVAVKGGTSLGDIGALELQP